MAAEKSGIWISDGFKKKGYGSGPSIVVEAFGKELSGSFLAVMINRPEPDLRIRVKKRTDINFNPRQKSYLLLSIPRAVIL
jgi:hypothetical protein